MTLFHHVLYFICQIKLYHTIPYHSKAFFYYRDIIYNLYQAMCTYSQLKKNNYVYPHPYPASGGEWRTLCPKIVRV